jgi:hypothetical protein
VAEDKDTPLVAERQVAGEVAWVKKVGIGRRQRHEGDGGRYRYAP